MAKLSQSLKQQQSLMMTPQLQQAIKLLTLTHMEMTNLIAQEMTENPMLEETGSEVTKAEAEYDDKVSQEKTVDQFEGPKIMEGKEDFDWNKYAESYDSNSSTPYQPSMVSTDSEDQPNYENIVSKSVTLTEHLEWQLRMELWGEDEWAVLQYLINNIDEDGYLEVTPEEVHQKSNHPIEDIKELLRMVQRLDPVGCGSRSLEECLLVQAEELQPRSDLAELLIKSYLKELHTKDYQEIIRKTAVSLEKIKDAEHIILGLNPKPGRLIGGDDTQYIVPDIYVKQVGDELQVQLNDEGVPRLRISHLYKSMLNQMSDAKTQEYVQDKLRAALWLIKSIENRQKTIEKVALAIVKFQPEFFRKGSAYLKPMILKDIAAEIGMHESTVSRVTTNKFMHTPLGIFELKFFFNTGIGGKEGGLDIASEGLKVKIKSLIEAENPTNPLSDQKLAELLSVQDIKVARRTVAKYREMLRIPPSSLRKKKS